MSATVVFTPIVHGPHDGQPWDETLRCTVHVGIRLDPGGDPTLATLTGWPDVLAWPQTPLQVAVVFADGSASAPVDIPPVDPAAFAAFLPPETPVLAFAADQAPAPIDGPFLWYDGPAVAQVVQQQATEAGKTTFGVDPAANPGSALVAPVVTGAGLGTRVAPPSVPPVPPALATQIGAVFTKPIAPPNAAPPSPPVDVEAKPLADAPPDFHQSLATLHGVPSVLPALRLTFAISVPWPAGVAQPSAISLAVTLPEASSLQAMTPYVSVAPTQAADGLLPPDLWTAIPFDLTGAAHTLAATAGASALRSAGFALHRLPADGGPAAIADMNARRARIADSIGQSPATAFLPSDFVRGWRVDAMEASQGVWRTLCRVDGSIARGGQAVGFIGAEGAVTPIVGADPDGTIRANDSLARWLGWSLIASAPGATAAGPSADSSFALAQAVSPGTLPTLRYGKAYSFRLRSADVAGGGLALTDLADGTGASTPQPFLRLEPAAAPTLLFGSTAQAGESPAQMVVLSGPAIAVPATSVRYALPPACSTEVALLHGMLDTAAGVPDPAAISRLLTGTAWSSSAALDANPLKADLYAATTFDAPPAVPYLPDPGAAALALRALDNGGALGLADNAVVLAPFASAGAAYPGGWSAVTINLTATEGAGSVTQTGAVLDCALGPGQMATLAFSSAIDANLIGHFALPAWVAAAVDADDAALHAQAVTSGGVPAVSAVQTVTLLHATQKPAVAPAFAAPGPLIGARQAGDTTVLIAGVVSFDALTTASVGIVAQWAEWVDNGPGTAAPALVAHKAELGPLTWSAGNDDVSWRLSQPLHTTQHVSIALTPVGQSAFAEMFPAGTDCGSAGASATLAVPASRAPLAPRLLYAIPTFAWKAVATLPQAITRTRSGNALRLWLERPFFTSGTNEQLAVILGAAGDSGSAISRWGVDPIAVAVDAPGVGAAYGAGDFVAPTARRIAGANGLTLALHDVHYDAVSDRYYCDVIFNAAVFGSAYRPFVQLVIAAYQPDALGPDQQLSTTVDVPAMQVFSDRSFGVQLGDGTAPSSPHPMLSVWISGHWPAATAPGALQARGLQTAAGLDIAFDGQVVSIPSQPVVGGGGGSGGHGNPNALPPSQPPSFDDGDGVRSFDAETYRVGSRVVSGAWSQCVVNVWETEQAGMFTLRDEYARLPNGTITIDPPPGTPITSAVFLPSLPYPRTMRLVYSDRITIDNVAAYTPPAGASLQVVAIRKVRKPAANGMAGVDQIATLGIADINGVTQPVAVSDAIALIKAGTNAFYIVDGDGARADVLVDKAHLRSRRDKTTLDNLHDLPSF